MGTACLSWTRNACAAPSPRATAHTLPVPNRAAINDVAVSTSGNRVGVGTASGSVYVLNSQGAAIRQAPHPETSILALATNSSGSLVVAGTADGRVFAFDSQGAMSWEVFLGGSVSSVAVNSSGNKIAAASGNSIYLLSGQ